MGYVFDDNEPLNIAKDTHLIAIGETRLIRIVNRNYSKGQTIENRDIDVLLEGDPDQSVIILTGHSDRIMDIINQCYNARELGVGIQLELEKKTITFK